MNNGSHDVDKDAVQRSQRNGRHVSNEIRMMSMQPDVIVPELYQSSIGRKSMTDDDLSYDDERENEGLENNGYASPAKFDARHSQPNGNYRFGVSGGNDPVARVGKVSLVQSLKNGDLHRSPTRLQYVPPKASSPHGILGESGREVSSTKSHSPVNKPIAAFGLITSSPVEAPTATGSSRSTPFGGTPGCDVLTPMPQPDDDFVAARIRHLRSTPTVGLTVDEVNRITDSRRGTPAVGGHSLSTTSSDDDDYDGRRLSPDIVNRTDFTRNDLELVVGPSGQRLSTPRDSSSSDDDDDTNYDTFTNSDYEYVASRPPRSSDFGDPYRLRMPPPTSTPPQPPPNNRRKGASKERPLFDSGEGTVSSAESTIDDSFSVDGGRRSGSTEPVTGATSSGRSSVDILQAGELLGWGLRIDQLVGVFNDIAALPDSGGGRSSAAGRDDPPSSRPNSTGSGSRNTRTPRQSSAELFERTRSPSSAEMSYMNAPRTSPIVSAGDFIYGDGATGTPADGRSVRVTPWPVSLASEADNAYLDALPYITTASSDSRPTSSVSRSDAATPCGGTSRTTKTPTPVNRNVSPLDIIREDEDATNNSQRSSTRSGYSRNVVKEEYV